MESLERENGSLVRMYALCQQTLRERTGQLNAALAVVEAVISYRRAAAEAGHPMLPWPALEIALEPFDATPKITTYEFEDETVMIIEAAEGGQR